MKKGLMIMSKEANLLAFAEERAIHMRILQLFIENYENVGERIRQAFLRKDIQATEREIHTLKGILVTIGDDSAHQVAKALEDELRRNYSQVKILQLIEQLAKEMLELMQILNKIVEEKQSVN